MNDSTKAKFRELSEKYGLNKDDFFKAPQGFVIITRTGIEKIQRGLSLIVQYEVETALCDVDKGYYVIKAIAVQLGQEVNVRTGKMEDTQRLVETYGESSPKNCRNSYPVAMAEKRALSRAVLKSADLYELGVYGEDEIEQ